MTFAVTLVHAPGALKPGVWNGLRQHAPGVAAHEVRLMVQGAPSGHSLSGPQLDHAVRSAIAGWSGVEDAALVQISCAGRPIEELPPESELIHPGMVVLITSGGELMRRPQPPSLSLCLDTGPDAGRLIRLTRGQHKVGRGQADIQVADPAVSRTGMVMEVGTHHISLKSQRERTSTAVTAHAPFQLGSTRCELAIGSPSSATEATWPPPPCTIRIDPPQGSNTVMLAFALVPLIAGIVMVMLTGMWFFLLFSTAGALIAGTLFLRSRREHARYQRAVAEAARQWADAAEQCLISPGHTARLLRSSSPEVSVSASGVDGPVVRLGEASVRADLTHGNATPIPGRGILGMEVDTVLGAELAPSGLSRLHGPARDVLRLQRWIFLQCLLNPRHPEVAIYDPQCQGLAVPPVQDIPRAHLLQVPHSLPRIPHSRTGVLISAIPMPRDAEEAALSHGWHVVRPGSGSSGTTSSGWRIDLKSRTVTMIENAAASLPLGNGEGAHHGNRLRYDGLSRETLEVLCRLAIPRCSGGSGQRSVPTSTVLPLPQDFCAGSAIEALTAVLGQSATGVEELDMVSDGPHVLISGTTGSGKSELLKTALLSLCARYGPNELTMVLMDFKGGATFQPLRPLNHVLAVVTDLSRAQAERTVESIRSELIRREKLFLDGGAGDYQEYRSLHPDHPLPRMLVVIDEFRIFSHELPDQLDELMRLATLGRSLGLHLVLSTQRPQGVITGDIRANIGAAVSLRMRSAEESIDTIGLPDAAEISRKNPGRALLRRPGEPPVLFQTAQLQAGSLHISLHPETHPTPPPATPSTAKVVETIQAAVIEAELNRPSTPLLPPLPERLSRAEALHTGRGALLCRIDDPAAQHQADLRVDPNRPQALALVGEDTAGAGPALSALVAQLLTEPAPAHVYLMDAARILASHARHRRVGSWLTDEELTEAHHLLSELCAELSHRRMGRGRTTVPLVLVITGFGRWYAADQASAGAGLEHQLGILSAEGPQAGISVVISGGRELALGRLSERIPHRIYLPYGAPENVTYLWPKLRSTDPLPGRGVLIGPDTAPPGLTVQLVTEASDDDGPGTSATTPPVDDVKGTEGASTMIEVRALPERVEATEGSPAGAPGTVQIGVEQFSLAPYEMGLDGLTLIIGSLGTGKTTALHLLHQRCAGAVLMEGGAGQLPESAEVLLVDNAHRCSAAEHRLIEQALAAEVPVVATALPSSSVFSQLPWAHHARSQGSCFLLSPVNRSETDAFPVAVPLMNSPVPGRAVHLRTEGARVLQWYLSPV